MGKAVKPLRGISNTFVAFAAYLLCAALPAAPAAEPSPKFDGPDNCAECHRPMHATWMHTAHYQTFFSAHRMRSGRRIAERLGIERIKQSKDCASCHYTVQPEAQRVAQPIAGISCESCHGPAGKWNTIHADTTDPDAMKKAEALGLIRPGNIAGMVDRCYACHTVNDEKLVNQGGHNPGSEFEMVAWLEGEVRHNFMKTKGAQNQPTPPERKRLFYVIGQITALETAIREFAKSRADGEFADIRIARKKRAIERLHEIQKRLKIDTLGEIVSLGESTDSNPEAKGQPARAADAIGRLKRKFAADHDGSKLGAVDKLLPQAEDHLGDVYRP